MTRMSDPQIAKHIATNYRQAQEGIVEARAALKRVKHMLEADEQPAYELRMLDEFDIVLKNTLRFELTNERNRWDDIVVERKKG